MPDELPFEPIKLKSPSGASPPFTLRWRLAIAALNGGPGSYTNVQLVLRNALDEEGWLAD
jgi:hypothetical protein